MATFAFGQDVTGDWHGTLNANGAELRLVLHISKNADGRLKATLDSVDQGANGIPVTSAMLKDSTLSLKVDAVQGGYEGKINADASQIVGTWTQGRVLDLTFHGAASLPSRNLRRRGLATLMAIGWERLTGAWASF